MTASQSMIQPIVIADLSQTYLTINAVDALQTELAMLQAKVINYYHDEIVLRGDKVLMREYCGHFGIEP